MADDTKTPPAGDKKVEAPKSLEDALKVIESLTESVSKIESKLKETTEESIKRKEKIRAIEQDKADAENAKLKAKGEFETLVQTLEPKAKRAETLEAELKKYYDLEIADIPEEKRTLIPQGPIESQLGWLKNAKAQGLFGAGAPKNPPANSDQKKPGDPNVPEFLNWAPTDERLKSLSVEDYVRWKKHNKRDGTGATGNQMAWGASR